MTITTTTHLNFRGNAGAALAFYQAAFDGQLTVVTYGQAGQAERDDEAGHVMWGQVTTDSGFRVMAFDVPASRPWHPGENAVFVAVAGSSAADITGPWDKLMEGGTVLQPLAPAQWSPLYGMLTDRFGITWIISVAGPAA
jgi:PhnB protein